VSALRGYAHPVDPEQAGAEAEDDVVAAAAKARAFIGAGLAVMAKLHADLTHPDEVVPDDEQSDAALAEGSRLLHRALAYIDVLAGCHPEKPEPDDEGETKTGGIDQPAPAGGASARNPRRSNAPYRTAH